MDRPADLARYIDQGLKAIGYPGQGEWDDSNDDGVEIHEDGTVVMKWVWGKDDAFVVTIQEREDFYKARDLPPSDMVR